jgi:hypothetical protein
VAWKLDDPDFSDAVYPAHPKPAALYEAAVLSVDAVTAVVVFGRLGRTIEVRGAGIRRNAYLPLLSNQRARERSDYEPLGAGICLGVVGVSEPENVARELDDRVLKAGSGADERDTAFARISNGRQRAIHVSVRAPGGDQEAAVHGQPLLLLVSDRICRHPLEWEPDVPEGVIRQQVVPVLRIEVANDADEHSHDASILLDALGFAPVSDERSPRSGGGTALADGRASRGER